MCVCVVMTKEHGSISVQRTPRPKSAPGEKTATFCIMVLEPMLPFIRQERNVIRKERVLELSEKVVSVLQLPPGAILSRSSSRSSHSQVEYCSFPMC